MVDEPKPKQVVSYETSDGDNFKSFKEAQAHERWLKLKEFIKTNVAYSDQQDAVIEFIITYGEEVWQLLNLRYGPDQ